MIKQLLSIFFIIALHSALSAQKIDNTASFRDIKADRYFRFNYDNDFFAARDQDYTQGYSFELVSPAMKKNPINRILLNPKKTQNKYGLAIEHIGFTAFNIKSPDIQYSDRPFAAAIMLKNFSIATDTLNKYRLMSSANVGLIGPGAFGNEMQTAIHKATGNPIPYGWKNQIKNDLVLNYEISFEKQLLRYKNLFSLQSNTTLRLGTLFTNATVGCNATFGIINNPFISSKTKRTFSLYGYAQPLINAIGYDATLQGGLFNRKSPYTIADSKIQRLTTQLNYGLVLQTKTLYFEYSRASQTKEFKHGRSSKWGGIKVGLTF